MSIKKLINALFQLSGSRAMPVPDENSAVNVYEGTVTSNQNVNFVAPTDGYLCATANSNTESAELVITFGDMSTGVPAAAQGWGLRCFAPLKKGTSCVVGTVGLASLNVKFYKLVGGGLRAFLRKLFGVCGEVCYV